MDRPVAGDCHPQRHRPACPSQARASKDWQPAAEADRVTLIRRLSFDLTGLPPKPEEVDAFVNDQSARGLRPARRSAARLRRTTASGWRCIGSTWCGSPTRSAITATTLGTSSPYRDYVISAFNENKPFNQFTLEQLAGDSDSKRDDRAEKWRQVTTAC